MEEEQEKLAALSHVVKELESISEIYPDITLVFVGIAKTSYSEYLRQAGESYRVPVAMFMRSETPQDLDDAKGLFQSSYISYVESCGVEAKDQILYEAEEAFCDN